MASAGTRPRRDIVALALALCMFGGCQLFRPRAPLHPEAPAGSWHTVQPGETLTEIAARAGVPVADLEEINGLRREEPLAPGRVIYLLDREALTAPSGNGPGDPAAAGPVTQLRWPLSDPRVSSPFGTRLGQSHEGVDFSAPLGTSVFAAAPGYVLYAGDGVRGYGNMVVLQHGGDLLTVYAHNSLVLVRTGDKIAAGQEIAKVGQSGRAVAPHLHFEVRRNQVPQDPLRFLPARQP